MRAGEQVAAVAIPEVEPSATGQFSIWLTESIRSVFRQRMGHEPPAAGAEGVAHAVLSRLDASTRAEFLVHLMNNPSLREEFEQRLKLGPSTSKTGLSAQPEPGRSGPWVDRLVEMCQAELRRLNERIDAEPDQPHVRPAPATEISRRRVREVVMEDLREAVEGPLRLQVLRQLAQERGQPMDELIQTLSAGDRFDQALKALIEGKFCESAQMFAEMADARETQCLPSAAEAYLFQGNALICLGHYTRAAGCFSKCLALGLSSAIAWNNHGVAQMGDERLPEAIESFDRAIELWKDYALAWCHRGKAWARRGDHERALEDYKIALRFNPSYYRSWYNRGRSLAALRRFEEASETFETALQIYARDPALWYARGNTLFKLQRYEEAIGSYDRALVIDPDHYFALTNRGVALAIVGWGEAALGSFEKALEIDPTYSRAWYNRGIVLQRLGEVAAARASIERFLSCAPPNAPALDAARGLLQQMRQASR
ncbi:MAG: tetratricopeptide repeat protein [Acidobacteria bacterium]|nr:tetratricopeptide repeat protein [Acidobacteriota bacterium]